MRICTKHGSALFLCIVSSVALAICGIFAQAARYRMIEAEVYRALTAQINAILVRGGGEMSSRYGLRCFEAGPDDLTVFSRLTERLAGVDMARTLPQSPVRDPGVLTGAVDIFMRYRLPAILTAQIVQRIQSVSQEIRSKTSSMPDIGSGGANGATIGKAVSDWLISFDFSGYLGVVPETASDENPKTPPHEESGGESSAGSPAADTIRERIQAFLLDRILGEDLLRELQRIQNCLVRYQAGEAMSESSGFRFPDMLDPEAVSSFLSGMDEWLRLDADPLYQKIGQVEYVMGMCSRSMPDAGQVRPVYADGIGNRDFAALSSAEGPDIERMISGCMEGDKAERWVFSAMLAIRFAACAIGIFTNPTRFGQAKTAAAAISGVVALISAGSVVIPEPPLSIVIASVWGLAEAYDEANRLQQGASVALYPGFDPIVLRYDDYLRFFLYFVPAEMLVQRLGQVLLRNVPGEYYRSISITAMFREREFSLTGRYPS